MRVTEEAKAKMLELFKQGKTNREISEIVNFSYDLVNYWRMKYTSLGYDIPKNKVAPVQRKKREPIKIMREYPPIPEGVEVVNCTPRVSRTCIYGFEQASNESMCCQYSLCENQSRPCPPEFCWKYSRVSRQNPRKRDLGI